MKIIRQGLQISNNCTIIIMLLLGFELQVRNREDYIMGTEEYIKEIIRLCYKISNVKLLRQIYTILLVYVSKHRGS